MDPTLKNRQQDRLIDSDEERAHVKMEEPGASATVGGHLPNELLHSIDRAVCSLVAATSVTVMNKTTLPVRLDLRNLTPLIRSSQDPLHVTAAR